MNHTERFNAFCALHAGPGLLVIGNAWDVASALAMEPYVGAISVSSAPAAAAFGYPDDESFPLALLRDTVERVSVMVRVPVAADVQAGYSSDPAACARHIVGIASAGAVGINLEDSSGGDLVSSDLHVRKIEAVRAATEAAGRPVFINARTDAFAFMPAQNALREAVRRAGYYVAAGAHGIFVPFTNDIDVIRVLASEIQAPLNVLVTSAQLRMSELLSAGVRRVSFGPGPMGCALYETRSFYATLRSEDRAAHLGRPRITHDEMQALLTERR